MKEAEILMALATVVLVSVATWFAWSVHWILGAIVLMFGAIYIVASIKIVAEEYFVLPEFLGVFLGVFKRGPHFLPKGFAKIVKEDNFKIKTIPLFNSENKEQNFVDFAKGGKGKITAPLRARIGKPDEMARASHYEADEESGGSSSQIVALFEAAIRDAIQEETFEDFMQQTFKTGDLLKGLLEKNDPEGTKELIQKAKDIGWKILDIPFEDIQPDEETAKTRAEQYQSLVDLKEAEMKAEREAMETAGTVIQMLAQNHGKTKKEIQEEMKKDKKLQKEFKEILISLLKQKRAIDGKAYFAFENLSPKKGKGTSTDMESLVMQVLAMLTKQQAKPETNKKERKKQPGYW